MCQIQVVQHPFNGEHGFYIDQGSTLSNPYWHQTLSDPEMALDNFVTYFMDQMKQHNSPLNQGVTELVDHALKHGQLNLIVQNNNEFSHGHVLAEYVEWAVVHLFTPITEI